EMIPWLSAFLDEGLSGYGMPLRERGFYAAWRELASEDRTPWFLGIGNFSGKVRDLPETPEDALTLSLDRLGIPEDSREDYLRSHLHQLPGWTGFIKWREGEPGYPMQERHPIDLVSYLAVRLFYESELVDCACREKWGIGGNLSEIQAYMDENPEDPGASSGDEKKEEHSDPVSGDAWRLFQLAQFLELSIEDIQRAAGPEIRALLELLDRFPAEEQGPVWLTALERSYRDLLFSELRQNRSGDEKAPPKRPQAQALFCIDARSEGLRRNLESRGPYETFGIAGFFGVPLCYRPYRGEEDYLLCPVLFKPERRAAEHPRADQRGAVRSFETAREWDAAGHELFHDLKANNLSAFPVIDFFSPGFGLRLFGRSLFPALDDRWRGRLKRMFPPEPQTEIRLERPGEGEGLGETSAGLSPDFGFNSEEQCGLVENALRMVGLTRNFSRLILFCAHGSRTENNPYAAAYDC
ncbi:MAG TPA: putative inorganic carbon transporter subunit DabA, partial [Nitrospiria bacterium]|nr:putative inorganic carbon transporter subunit DabA [Nitrospiria bacterium]